MATVMWERDVAEAYDATSAAMFAPEVLDPMITVLAELAADGAALEFALGTGRVALPLAARGVHVHGIELSPHMVAQFLAKPGSDEIPVVVGDMASAKAEGSYSLVYLVFNTIMNVTTANEQLAVFANAAAHLMPGGHFVVEVVVPQIRRLPEGELGRVFALTDDHIGIETFDDPVGQISWSHHWMQVDGRLVRHSAPYRYVWPSELDLMAHAAGLEVTHRWSDWKRAPFDETSTSQVVVYRKP